MSNVSQKHPVGGALHILLPDDLSTIIKRAARDSGMAPSALVIDVLRDAFPATKIDQEAAA